MRGCFYFNNEFAGPLVNLHHARAALKSTAHLDNLFSHVKAIDPKQQSRFDSLSKSFVVGKESGFAELAAANPIDPIALTAAISEAKYWQVWSPDDLASLEKIFPKRLAELFIYDAPELQENYQEWVEVEALFDVYFQHVDKLSDLFNKHISWRLVNTAIGPTYHAISNETLGASSIEAALMVPDE